MVLTDEKLVQRLQGKFLVFDGPDGCGKSTQRELFGRRLQEAGGDVIHCKDPGGTEFGNMIRSILLTHDLSKMDVRCETFLFMASRAQLVGEVIEPAIAAGRIVLCDRFISSTCAYQVAAGYDVSRVLELGNYAVSKTWPDLTVIFDVTADEGFRRTGRQPKHAGKNRNRHAGQGLLLDDVQHDAMEARPLDFHRRVRDALIKLPEVYPKPVIVLDGTGDSQVIHNRVWEAVCGADF